MCICVLITYLCVFMYVHRCIYIHYKTYVHVYIHMRMCIYICIHVLLFWLYVSLWVSQFKLYMIIQQMGWNWQVHTNRFVSLYLSVTYAFTTLLFFLLFPNKLLRLRVYTIMSFIHHLVRTWCLRHHHTSLNTVHLWPPTVSQTQIQCIHLPPDFSRVPFCVNTSHFYFRIGS